MKKTKYEPGDVYNPYQMFKKNLLIPSSLASIPVASLSQGAKLTFGRLRMYAGKNAQAFPKRKTLAKQIGCSTRQVDNYIKELVELGVISTKRIGLGRSNRYSFVWSDILDEDSCDTDLQDSSITNLQDTDTHNKEVQIMRNKKGSETARAANHPFDELKINTLKVYSTYCKKINSKFPLDYESEMAIMDRLQNFTVEQLETAIENFSLSTWHMRNHRYNRIKTFFRDNDRIYERMEMEPDLKKHSKEDNNILML